MQVLFSKRSITTLILKRDICMLKKKKTNAIDTYYNYILQKAHPLFNKIYLNNNWIHHRIFTFHLQNFISCMQSSHGIEIKAEKMRRHYNKLPTVTITYGLELQVWLWSKPLLQRCMLEINLCIRCMFCKELMLHEQDEIFVKRLPA